MADAPAGPFDMQRGGTRRGYRRFSLQFASPVALTYRQGRPSPRHRSRRSNFGGTQGGVQDALAPPVRLAAVPLM
jgi:hypothetical protein